MTTTVMAAMGSAEWEHLFDGVLASLAYVVLGLVILALGFVILDAITPGNLRELVYIEHKPNAVILASANHIALTAVVIAAIVNSADNLAQGLVDTAVYGVLGIIFQTTAFIVVELVVPGKKRALVQNPHLRPGAVALAVIWICIGLVNAVAIS